MGLPSEIGKYRSQKAHDIQNNTYKRNPKRSRGLRESYSKGYYAGGQPMLGYDIVENHWVKNPEEVSDMVSSCFYLICPLLIISTEDSFLSPLSGIMLPKKIAEKTIARSMSNNSGLNFIISKPIS